jgi:hypothetical protein
MRRSYLFLLVLLIVLAAVAGGQIIWGEGIIWGSLGGDTVVWGN